jgi:hypothetical protein
MVRSWGNQRDERLELGAGARPGRWLVAPYLMHGSHDRTDAFPNRWTRLQALPAALLGSAEMPSDGLLGNDRRIARRLFSWLPRNMHA